jgi:hypothetical protein
MRTRTVWTIIACIILVPLLLIGIGAEWLFGFSQLLYKPVRYRVATAVDVVDRGVLRRNIANSDCWAYVSTRGVFRGLGKSRRGEDNHVLLGDGSILILPDLDPCRWVETRPAPGTSYVLAPAPRGGLPQPAGTAELRPAETWRFDSAVDPASVTIYQLTELFQQEHDELQIKSAMISAVGAGRENDVGYALEDRFPWFRDVPRGDALKDYGSYRRLHHHGNFLGFRASVTQLVGGSRCPVHDPNAEGPIVIPMQASCTFVNNCTRGDERLFCGKAIGWLAGTANSGFSELTFTNADPSPAKVAVLYREPILVQAGAPGDRSQPSLRWKPRLCLDGLCIEGDVASTGIPPWTQFYYPARNQFVTVWPLSFYAAGAFRRVGASH